MTPHPSDATPDPTHDPELIHAVEVTLWRLECRHAPSLTDEPPEVRDGFRSDALAVLEAIALFRPTTPLTEEWIEWGVRRTWGDGSVAHFGHGELSARRAADRWPGIVVKRWVAACATEWEEA
jgi:hypothetical protein